MFMKHVQIAPARVAGLLKAAEAAARAIPPAFPLDATVAVNPFLGQTGEDLATASARLARVAGVRITRTRDSYAADVRAGVISDDDLAAALIGCTSPVKPADLAMLKAALGREAAPVAALPTVADLAADAVGTDWPSIIARCVGQWAAGHFDRGQALWSPGAGRGAFAAWRDWALHDLTPEIAGLTGFCAFVAGADDTAERVILRAADRLGLTRGGGRDGVSSVAGGYGRLVATCALVVVAGRVAGGHGSDGHRPAGDPADLGRGAAGPCAGGGAGLGGGGGGACGPGAGVAGSGDRRDLPRGGRAGASAQAECGLAGAGCGGGGRPVMQAAFCIDVRSEVFRRALEQQDPGIETIGFAGFFGLPLQHRAQGTEEVVSHLPVLLNPALTSTGHAAPEVEQAARIAARTSRAWGRFRQAAVSSFAFVEAAGPVYGAKLLRDALGMGAGMAAPEPAPRIEGGLSAEAKAATGGCGVEGDEPDRRPCAAGAAVGSRGAGDQQPA